VGELRFELAKPHEGAWQRWRGIEQVLLFQRAIEASPGARSNANHVPTTAAGPRSTPTFRRELEQGGELGCVRGAAAAVLVVGPSLLFIAGVRSGQWPAALFVLMGSCLCFGFAGRIWAWRKYKITHYLQVTPEEVSFCVFRMNIKDRLVKEQQTMPLSEISGLVLADPCDTGARTSLLVRGAEVAIPPFLLWDRNNTVRFAQSVRRHLPDVPISGDRNLVQRVLADSSAL
jgi:hypothetical protein